MCGTWRRKNNRRYWGNLPFKQELIRPRPPGQGVPMNATYRTELLQYITHAQPHHCHTHTQMWGIHQQVRTNFVLLFLSHTRSIFFIRGQKKTNPVPRAQNPVWPFSERIQKGISWHQPNGQATARVGKRGKLNVYWGKIHAGGSRLPLCTHGQGVRSALRCLRTEHPHTVPALEASERIRTQGRPAAAKPFLQRAAKSGRRRSFFNANAVNSFKNVLFYTKSITRSLRLYINIAPLPII